MSANEWHRSAGGVCDNCGEPRLAHDGEACPDDARVAALADRIDRWHQTVDPTRNLKDHARRFVRMMRNWAKKGWCKTAHLERAERIYELARGEYEAMIELADQAGRDAR